MTTETAAHGDASRGQGAGRVAGIGSAVVLPAYNERCNLEWLLPKLHAVLPQATLIVVDDDSPDGTPEWLQECGRSVPRLEPLVRRGKRGYASATMDGFRRALALGADRVVTMDADGSHDPEAVPGLLDELRHRDVVLGSRYVGGCRVLDWPLRRLFLSVAANFYVRTALGMPYRDSTSGFRCYRAPAIERLLEECRISSEGYSFLVETLYFLHRRGERIGEAPIVFQERRTGASKMDRRIIVEAMFCPWRLRLVSAARVVAPGAAARGRPPG